MDEQQRKLMFEGDEFAAMADGLRRGPSGSIAIYQIVETTRWLRAYENESCVSATGHPSVQDLGRSDSRSVATPTPTSIAARFDLARGLAAARSVARSRLIGSGNVVQGCVIAGCPMPIGPRD